MEVFLSNQKAFLPDSTLGAMYSPYSCVSGQQVKKLFEPQGLCFVGLLDFESRQGCPSPSLTVGRPWCRCSRWKGPGFYISYSPLSSEESV